MRMSKVYADAAAHNSIPDDFLWCLLTRRHTFPRPRDEVKVRIRYGNGAADVLEVFESVADCGLCGTNRIYWRDQITNGYVHAEYKRPDGYDPPPGRVWDRSLLWEVFRERHPVKGRVRVVDRRAG